MRLQIRNSRRRGTVLAYSFLLIFGMLAITAMVTDVGFAILTHRQMLTAVDSAALEGLRNRDLVIEHPIDGTSLVGLTPDQVRRLRASQRVAEVFDDDYVWDHNP